MNRAGGSPYPGGKFSAEPQRWGFAVCGRQDVAAPAAGAKRKDNLRFSFLFGLLPFPCFLIWRRFPICDRSEKEYGRGFFLPCLSQPVRSVRYRSATHVIKSTQARHDSAARFFCTLYRTASADLGVWSIYPRRPCLSQRAHGLRNTGMLRLRKFNSLCSRTVSDTANRLRKTRKKKSSAVPLFRSGHM